MSYRIGVYVIDRRRKELGRVMGNVGPSLQLRSPGGGTEWDCPPSVARLATQAECCVAGIAANGARTGRELSVVLGWCAYCEADRDDTVEVSLTERGTAPAHGFRLCLTHASQHAATRYAPSWLAAELSRLCRARQEPAQ